MEDAIKNNETKTVPRGMMDVVEKLRNSGCGWFWGSRRGTVAALIPMTMLKALGLRFRMPYSRLAELDPSYEYRKHMRTGNPRNFRTSSLLYLRT